MTQSVRNPAHLRKIGSTILIIDFIIGALLVLFGPAIFGLSIGISWLVGLVMVAGGVITYLYFRSVAERDQRTKTRD